VGREVVDMLPGETLAEWQDRMIRYPITIDIEGQRLDCARHEPLTVGASGILRFIFSIGDSDIASTFAGIRISSEFHASLAQREFPVKFSSYYCVGPTEVSFEVQDRTAIIDWNDFISSANQELTFRETIGLQSRTISLQTPQHSVLRPGSGVVFVWNPPEALSLLTTPPAELLAELPVGNAVPDDIRLPSAPTPCQGRPEPLVPIVGIDVLDAYARLGIAEARPMLLREDVAERLRKAAASLPAGFGLVVLDAWRSLEFQRSVRARVVALVLRRRHLGDVHRQRFAVRHRSRTAGRRWVGRSERRARRDDAADVLLGHRVRGGDGSRPTRRRRAPRVGP
jgi:hypothetical protein